MTSLEKVTTKSFDSTISTCGRWIMFRVSATSGAANCCISAEYASRSEQICARLRFVHEMCKRFPCSDAAGDRHLCKWASRAAAAVSHNRGTTHDARHTRHNLFHCPASVREILPWSVREMGQTNPGIDPGVRASWPSVYSLHYQPYNTSPMQISHMSSHWQWISLPS